MNLLMERNRLSEQLIMFRFCSPQYTFMYKEENFLKIKTMRMLAYAIGWILLVGGMMTTGGGFHFLLGVFIILFTAITTPNEID